MAVSKDYIIVRLWRPILAVIFGLIMLTDYIIFPAVNMIIFKDCGNYTPWTPLTLKAAGTFFVAYGSILGIYTWGRTKEKTLGVDSAPFTTSEEK